MNASQPVHDLDSLEKEILRKKLELKEKEERLRRNLDDLQGNYLSYLSGSFFSRSKKSNGGKKQFFDSIISRVADKTADRAAETIDRLLNKLWKKKK
jgi:hypothetical protein